MFGRAKTTLSFAVASGLVACSPALFRSPAPGPKPVPAAASPAPTRTPPAPPAPTAHPTRVPLPENLPTPQPTEIPTAAPTATPEPVDICKDKTRSFKILILDLKSGWFAGDGGDFFKDFVANECKDRMQISYMHITKDFIEGNFANFPDYQDVLPCAKGRTPDAKGQIRFTQETNDICTFGSISSYDQLWILSGSEADELDIKRDRQFFISLKQRAVEMKNAKSDAGFFFGAGLSNSEHSNSIALTLFPNLVNNGNTEKLFAALATNTSPGVFPNVPQIVNEFGKAPLKAGNGRDKGTFDASQAVFSGIGSLFDFAAVSGRVMRPANNTYTRTFKIGECLTNPVIAPNMKVIATDNCGQPAVGTAQFKSHKVYADGNVARFYPLKPTDYFHRIILHLLP